MAESCRHRTVYYRHHEPFNPPHVRLPHLFTSRERKRTPDGEWSEWSTICSWCTKEKTQ